jgi:hypothetical protein
MPNPWVSLRCDLLIPINKAGNEKEQLEKGTEEEEKRDFLSQWHLPREPKIFGSNLAMVSEKTWQSAVVHD